MGMNRMPEFPEEAKRRAERSRARHYLFRAALLLAYSCFIQRLARSGSLLEYIAPRMETAVKLASIGLILLAGAQIWMALGGNRGHRLSCDCCEPAASPNGFRSVGLLYALFLLPVVYAVLLPNGMSGSGLAGSLGLALSGPEGSQVSAVLSAPVDTWEGNGSVPEAAGPAEKEPAADGAEASATGHPSELAALARRLYGKPEILVPETGYREVLRAVALHLDRFAGKRMTVSGFVFREKAMQPNEFAVARLVMSSSAADASPFGVLVRTSGKTDFPQDTWVLVSGTIAKETYGGEPVLALRADRVTRVSAPSNPYVYPYDGAYEDLANWLSMPSE
ncbi:TIGR03943 family putative permease subunit [Gorillibacterium sp. sgz500922]|uniref:TIGR03943 family putative permease subunit n=1 Tax=Gorillibacterium sp. sgz500922 TaxID=3446694 RepID=UPI003F674667